LSFVRKKSWLGKTISYLNFIRGCWIRLFVALLHQGKIKSCSPLIEEQLQRQIAKWEISVKRKIGEKLGINWEAQNISLSLYNYAKI
jgi:hypothetical protein